MGLRPVDLLEEGIDCVVRFGVQRTRAGSTASRYDDFRLLCEPCVLAEHGIRAGPRSCPPTDVSTMFQIAPDESSTGSSRETGRRSSSRSMAYWLSTITTPMSSPVS